MGIGVLDESPYPSPYRRRLRDAWTLSCKGAPNGCLTQAEAILHEAEAAGTTQGAASALQLMAWASFQLGEAEAGLDHARAAQELWRGLDFQPGIAWTEAMCAWLLLECGLSELASAKAVEAFAMAERLEGPVRGFAANVLGVVLWYCRHFDRARALCAEAVREARQRECEVVLGWWLINLAGVHADLAAAQAEHGEPERARASWRTAIDLNGEAITLAMAHDDGWGLRIALCNGAEYLTGAGRVDEALELLQRCEAMPAEVGERSRAHLLYTKAQVLTEVGRLDEAIAACEASLAIAERQSQVDSVSYALRYLSEIHERAGRFETALALFKRFHSTKSRLAGEEAQRQARIAEIVYENRRFRAMVGETQRQLDHVTRQSRQDPLTGLPNRRGFDDIIGSFIRDRRSYALAVVDLDHFKTINDNHSHLVGDAVLKDVAGDLARLCGTPNHAARFGGEEFVLLIDTPQPAVAVAFCEAVRQSIMLKDRTAIAPGLSVTASIGLAQSWRDAEPSDVLAMADARLYLAKNSGRNRVVATDAIPFVAVQAASA